MIQDNIFICFKKNGERSLILKVTKKKEYYYDINNDVIIEKKDIDFNSLVSFSNYNKTKKGIINKNRLRKIYNKDSQTEFNTKNLAYYNIYCLDDCGNLILVKENVLLRKYFDEYQEWYVNIYENKIVAFKSFKYNTCSDNIVKFIRNVNIDEIMQKKKILEMDYKKEL